METEIVFVVDTVVARMDIYKFRTSAKKNKTE